MIVYIVLDPIAGREIVRVFRKYFDAMEFIKHHPYDLEMEEYELT